MKIAQTAEGDRCGDAEIDFPVGRSPSCPADQITADYNVLVFDADGNYLPGDPNSNADIPISGIDNQLLDTGEAIEYAEPARSTRRRHRHHLPDRHHPRLESGAARTAARLRYYRLEDGRQHRRANTSTPASPRSSVTPPPRNADGVAAFDVHDASTIPEALSPRSAR